jgi:hypothetical protein
MAAMSLSVREKLGLTGALAVVILAAALGHMRGEHDAVAAAAGAAQAAHYEAMIDRRAADLAISYR